MWIEGDEAHVSDLRNFKIAEDLAGKVFVRKAAIAELNDPPGDLVFEVSPQIKVHRTHHGKRYPADDGAVDAIIQESVAHPPALSEFLCHRSPLTARRLYRPQRRFRMGGLSRQRSDHNGGKDQPASNPSLHIQGFAEKIPGQPGRVGRLERKQQRHVLRG